MSAPVVAGANSASNYLTNSVDFVKPTGSVVGDLLLIIMTLRSSGTVNTPSGWTALNNAAGSGASPKTVAFRRVVDGTESASIRVDTPGSTFTAGVNGTIYRITGIDAAFPIDVSTSSIVFNSSGPSQSPITAVADELLFLVAHGQFGNPSGTTITVPAGFTQQVTGVANERRYTHAYKTEATAGSHGPYQWAYSAQASTTALITISVRPVGANAQPLVDVGADTAMVFGDTFTRLATASDVEGAVTYQWTITGAPSGSVATIAAPTSATATITPDLPGVYLLRLRVTDAGGLTATDTLTLTVRATHWVNVDGVAVPSVVRIKP